MSLGFLSASLVFVAFVSACRAPLGSGASAGADDKRLAVAAVLDDWHGAASVADGARYFGHMTENSVFVGTDATERWDLAAFRAFAEPYFSQGRGWTYVPIERHIDLSADGRTAWFDERLRNEKLGECRGSGVLVFEDGTWRIAQYVLSIPIPNDLAGELTQRIRAEG